MGRSDGGRQLNARSGEKKREEEEKMLQNGNYHRRRRPAERQVKSIKVVSAAPIITSRFFR